MYSEIQSVYGLSLALSPQYTTSIFFFAESTFVEVFPITPGVVQLSIYRSDKSPSVFSQSNVFFSSSCVVAPCREVEGAGRTLVLKTFRWRCRFDMRSRDFDRVP